MRISDWSSDVCSSDLHVTFVDRDRAAIRAIEANLAACDLAERATVVSTGVERFLSGLGPDQRWDLALIDPPYAHDADAWLDLLDALPVDLADLASDRPVEPPFGWEVLRAKRYSPPHVSIPQQIGSRTGRHRLCYYV